MTLGPIRLTRVDGSRLLVEASEILYLVEHVPGPDGGTRYCTVQCRSGPTFDVLQTEDDVFILWTLALRNARTAEAPR